MTSPQHAHESDNGRYYTCPDWHPQAGRELVSVTNALSVGMSKYGLPLWYAGHATESAWDHLPQMTAALFTKECGQTGEDSCGVCRPCLTRNIKAAAERARDKAADLGTRVHDLAEAHATGRQVAPQEGDDIAGLFVAQYLKFLKDFDVDITKHVEAAEITVANPGLGYAGTLDTLLWLMLDGFLPGEKVKPTGDHDRALWLVDYKSSLTRASTQTYPENSLQLTALRHATEMWLPDGSLIPMKRVKGTAVLNLRTKTYKLIPLPARAEHEFKAFKSILSLTQWLHGQWPGEYDYRPVKPGGAYEPKRGGAKKASASPTSDTKAA